MVKGSYNSFGVPWYSRPDTPAIRPTGGMTVVEPSGETLDKSRKNAWRRHLVAASVRLSWPVNRTFCIVSAPTNRNRRFTVSLGVFLGVRQDRMMQYWADASVFNADGSATATRFLATRFCRDAFWPSGELLAYARGELARLLPHRTDGFAESVAFRHRIGSAGLEAGRAHLRRQTRRYEIRRWLAVASVVGGMGRRDRGKA